MQAAFPSPNDDRPPARRIRNAKTDDQENEDAWWPFGARNDPKLRRSFNRGVPYANLPRSPVAPSKPDVASSSSLPEPPAEASKSVTEPERARSPAKERKTSAIQARSCSPVPPAPGPVSLKDTACQVDKLIEYSSVAVGASPRAQEAVVWPEKACIPQTPETHFQQHQCVPEQRPGFPPESPSTFCCSPSPSSTTLFPMQSSPLPPQPLHRQQWHFPICQWPPPPGYSPPSNPMTLAPACDQHSLSPSANSSQPPPPTPPQPLLLYQVVPYDVMTGLPAIVPQAGSPQFVYTTSYHGQPIPVTVHQPEGPTTRRDSRLSLPPIYSATAQNSSVASSASSEATFNYSWNSDRLERRASYGHNSREEGEALRRSEEQMTRDLMCTPPMPPRRKSLHSHRISSLESPSTEELSDIPGIFSMRTPSPDDYRPIRPSPGGKYQIPDLPIEELYNAIPVSVDTASSREAVKEPEPIENNAIAKRKSPSELGLFASVEVRRRKKTDPALSRKSIRGVEMSATISEVALKPQRDSPARSISTSSVTSSNMSSSPSPSVRLTPPKIETGDEQENKVQEQKSPREFFIRSQQYRSFSNRPQNTVNPAVEHLKMLKQKLLDHQKAILRRDRAFCDERKI